MPGLPEKESAFLEEVGLVFEKTGMPRMAGRLFGWLLISDPPYQSSSELAEALMASKGSVSTNARLLMQIGLIERFVIPGERHDHYRLSENALRKTVQHGLEDEIKMFLDLADQGLKLMCDEPSTRRAWLEQMRDRYLFLSEEFPALMERFEKWRAKRLVTQAGRKSR